MKQGFDDIHLSASSQEKRRPAAVIHRESHRQRGWIMRFSAVPDRGGTYLTEAVHGLQVVFRAGQETAAVRIQHRIEVQHLAGAQLLAVRLHDVQRMMYVCESGV